MKAKANFLPKAFKPINITITLESEHEVEALYFLFNSTDIKRVLNLKNNQAVRDAIVEVYGSIPTNDKTWEKFIELFGG